MKEIHVQFGKFKRKRVCIRPSVSTFNVGLIAASKLQDDTVLLFLYIIKPF